MSESPVISVLMVAHNAESTICLALSSLITQSYKNWQCHIVNDASTDATPAILSGLADPRFKIEHSARRLGRGGARNLALRYAAGTYLASLDADDFLFPYALESQVKTMEDESSLAACTGSLLLFDSDYRPLGRRRTQLRAGCHQIGSPLTTRVPLGSTVIRRDLVGQERFNAALVRSEDRDFFDRVLKGGCLRVLAQPTYAYRWNLQLDNVMQGLRNRENLFRRRFFSNPLRAGLQIVGTRIKHLCYPVLGRWGLWEVMSRWRVVPPTFEEIVLFDETLKTLRAQRLFS